MSVDWYNGLDLGKLVVLVFIDLKKAFDTVDHDHDSAKSSAARVVLVLGLTYLTANNSVGLIQTLWK